MNVGQAKAIARAWVGEHAAGEPRFVGAVFHGSVNWLAEDAELPASSDLDVLLVYADPLPETKPGKLIVRDVMLEVSHLALSQLGSPEAILGQSDLAGSFQTPNAILDPTGRLTLLQTAVAREYAARRWVRARCEHARGKILRNLGAIRADDPFHDQFTSWLFGTGVTTHILLVAGLRNPTVRKRYSAARELLADYGRSDAYEPLLALLGCADWRRERVVRHLAAMTAAFDAAKEVAATPFFFAADISDLARPVAVDGAWDLIDRSEHREAVFWIAATYARCQKVLHADGSTELAAALDVGFRALADDLGVGSFEALLARADEVRRQLPEIWAIAEEIMANNPG